MYHDSPSLNGCFSSGDWGGLCLTNKAQPNDEIVKIDNELGIAWIKLHPDTALGGFLDISPRIVGVEKSLSFKKRERAKERGGFNVQGRYQKYR